MSDVVTNYLNVCARIEGACRRVGRDPSSVKVVAVSKKQNSASMQALIDYFKDKKQKLIFGENYVQEYKKKRLELVGEYACHMIGALQRNKAKDAVKLFSVIESVHSVELAQALHREAKKEGRIQEVYLEVNVSQDDSKSGFDAVLAREFLFNSAHALANLKVTGLMTITKLYDTPEEARPDFAKLRILRDTLLPKFGDLELSMGMSSDYEIAIEEGATLVRVGTAIFGARSAN